MSLCIGDSFMLEDEDGIDEHLHVVMTNPSSAGDVVTVSISSRRQKSEILVCIQVGEHPFVTRESVCLYRFTRIRSVASIEAAFVDGTARQKEPVSTVLLHKLGNGLLESDFVPRGIRNFYRELTGNPNQ